MSTILSSQATTALSVFHFAVQGLISAIRLTNFLKLLPIKFPHTKLELIFRALNFNLGSTHTLTQ